jgi:hypothetical protein
VRLKIHLRISLISVSFSSYFVDIYKNITILTLPSVKKPKWERNFCTKKIILNYFEYFFSNAKLMCARINDSKLFIYVKHYGSKSFGKIDLFPSCHYVCLLCSACRKNVCFILTVLVYLSIYLPACLLHT